VESAFLSVVVVVRRALTPLVELRFLPQMHEMKESEGERKALTKSF
jgi:hypothetical protein